MLISRRAKVSAILIPLVLVAAELLPAFPSPVIAVLGDRLTWRSRSLGGWFLRNCGQLADSAITELEAGLALKCMNTAHRERIPFRVRFDYEEHDLTQRAQGFVMDRDGKVFEIVLAADAPGVRVWHQIVAHRICVEPVVFVPSKNKGLAVACQADGTQGQAANWVR